MRKIDWHTVSEWTSILHVLFTGVPLLVGFILWVGHSPLWTSPSAMGFLFGAETALVASVLIRFAICLSRSRKGEHLGGVLERPDIRRIEGRTAGGGRTPFSWPMNQGQITIIARTGDIVTRTTIGRHSSCTIAFHDILIQVVTY